MTAQAIFPIEITASDKTDKGKKSAQKNLAQISKNLGTIDRKSAEQSERTVGRSGRRMVRTFGEVEKAAARAFGGKSITGALADRLGAAARRDQHRRVLGKTLETLNSLRTTGFGGDHQSAVAVVVAYQDNAAPAQFCHGAFDGGERRCGTGMNLTRDHAFLYHGAFTMGRAFAEVNRFFACIVPDRVARIV